MIVIQRHPLIYYGPEPTAKVNPINLTDTIDNMKLPINCVLIGHQNPISKLMETTSMGPLRGIFNE